MALGDKLKVLRAKASQQLEAVSQDPQQVLKQAGGSVRSLLDAGVAAVERSSRAVQRGARAGAGQGVDGRLLAGEPTTEGAKSAVEAAPGVVVPVPASPRVAQPTTAIERVLHAALPDWHALLTAAERARENAAPIGVVAWAEKDSLRSGRGLTKGDDCDVWAIEGGLCLYRHPGLLDRLLGWLFALIAKLFAPLFQVRERLDSYLVQLASRLGVLFAVISAPLAMLGFVADALALFVALVRSLPALVFSPIALIREVVAIPFRLAMALVSRFLRTFLLAWVGGWLEDRSRIEDALRRNPWLRGVILGFFRNERPSYPGLIPAASVNQVLRVKRRGLTGTREYLVVVEGDPIEKGFGAWFRLKIKQLVLPFYWERTVHMLCLSDDAATSDRISQALGKQAIEWS